MVLELRDKLPAAGAAEMSATVANPMEKM